MLATLASLLLLLVGGTDPEVRLDPVLLADGAQILLHWEGGEGVAVHPADLDPGNWALRDASGRLVPLGTPGKPGDGHWALPAGATLEHRLAIPKAILAELRPGPAVLLLRRGKDWQEVTSTVLTRRITAGDLDFARPELLTLEDLATARVQLDVEIGGQPAGTMILEFWPDAAPNTVRNFLRYVAEGFYDGLTFHRVIPGFMIQGGDPRGNGSGSGPHGMIPGEFSKRPEHAHVRGVISMARGVDPNSASCQFFICHGSPRHLDGQYAAFGRLVSGYDVLDAVALTPTEQANRPLQPVVIREARLYLAREPM